MIPENNENPISEKDLIGLTYTAPPIIIPTFFVVGVNSIPHPVREPDQNTKECN